jgi:hypothetical protein
MADGPLDYGSGYIFESQKGISDRRAERGFPPGRADAARTRCSMANQGVSGGGWIATVLLGLLSLLAFLAPYICLAFLEVLKLLGKMLIWAFDAVVSGGRRR